MSTPLGITLVSVQQCHSCEGWVPVRIPSESHPGHEYTVWVVPWHDESNYICECRGYFYNGHCKHQARASAKLCGWRELDHQDDGDPLKQSPEQRKAKRCPSCGEPTTWTIEEVDGSN